MDTNSQDQIKNLIFENYETLSKIERDFIHLLVEHKHLAKNINKEFDSQLTFGQRVADKVAAFGGSWTFIIIFASILIAWVALNSIVLAKLKSAFDPYPYILLNLFLSMLAAIQAPIIMMSQNRQAAKDRLDAAHDYEVNLKAELEIAKLHEKIDELSKIKMAELIATQQEQLRILARLAKEGH
jgi:uncharacterized membrane protein